MSHLRDNARERMSRTLLKKKRSSRSSVSLYLNLLLRSPEVRAESDDDI